MESRMNQPVVIELWPQEIQCVVCDAWDLNRWGLAVCEGEILPDDWAGEWGGRSCCRRCYAAWQDGVIRPHMSFAEARVAVLARRQPVRPTLFRRLLARVNRFDITNAAGDVFMRRYKLLRTRWGNVYLHEILRSDEDLCLHDHPWSFLSLILWGGYREQMPAGTFWRRPGTLLVRPARAAHRIEVDRPAWSLVLVGPRRRAWGCFTPHGWRRFVPGQSRPVCEEGTVGT